MQIYFFLLNVHVHMKLGKRSHRICSNFAIIASIMAGTNSLKRFLKKTPGTEKHKDK